MSEDIIWREPEAGLVFQPDEVVVTKDHQLEKLAACGLAGDAFGEFVDASFFIGMGIHAGIKNGISAEGNVNMLVKLQQYQPVRLGEPLQVKGQITAVTPVPRGHTVATDVWFEDASGERVISVPRMSLRPDPAKSGERGAGERPAPVIADVSELQTGVAYSLTPEGVKSYSSEGNSIHYEMGAANKAGFRAPIIGGGMGVHYLLHALWTKYSPRTFDLDIYFRRPIFWDHSFNVAIAGGDSHWQAMCLASEGKVLTEVAIHDVS